MGEAVGSAVPGSDPAAALAGASVSSAEVSAAEVSAAEVAASAVDDLDPRQFRAAMSRYATGVVVVTTVFDGVDHAMTANSFTSVSLRPPLVLVCVERDSRFHAAVTAAGRWVVSVLPAGSADVARWFAAKGRPLPGQLDHAAHHRVGGGIAALDAALAVLECSTVSVQAAGDHDVVIGRVEALGSVNRSDPPLVYFASGFVDLAEGDEDD